MFWEPIAGARRTSNMQVLPQAARSRPRVCRAVSAWYPAPVLRADDMLPASDRSDDSDADEQLVRKVAEGDRAALGELYDRFAPSMLAVARRILGSEPEDLVQDVFLEAWHRARHFDPARGSVRTWLMLRVRSRSLDRLR